MPIGWTEAVWEAVRRLVEKSHDGSITRSLIISDELANIVDRTGSTGLTPQQTLSRVLQELRDDGVLLFDGQGRYRVSTNAAGLPLNVAIATETQALVNARLGQSWFRQALEMRWNGQCPLTGITERPLLRASHIVPWGKCEDESERLEPDNGILLSALWDAAFDRRLITFDDSGFAIACKGLAQSALAIMQSTGSGRIVGLSPGNRQRLAWHRAQCSAG